jgi:hypothetical protein
MVEELLGLLDLKRDIILRLLGYCTTERKSKLQNIVGMCKQTYLWRNHYVFDKTKDYSFRVKYGDNCYAFGKRDEDVVEVCGRREEGEGDEEYENDDGVITLYMSMRSDEKVRIKRKEIVEFEFGIYSNINIDDMFLQWCTSLTTPPTIPNSVTSIGYFFLFECASLTTSPTIPNSVTSIGDYFLFECTSLNTLPTIPNLVRRKKY